MRSITLACTGLQYNNAVPSVCKTVAFVSVFRGGFHGRNTGNPGNLPSPQMHWDHPDN